MGGVNLWADLVTANLPAEINPLHISAGRNTRVFLPVLSNFFSQDWQANEYRGLSRKTNKQQNAIAAYYPNTSAVELDSTDHKLKNKLKKKKPLTRGR